MEEELVAEAKRMVQSLEKQRADLKPIILAAPEDQIPGLFKNFTDIGTKIVALETQVGLLTAKGLRSSFDATTLKEMTERVRKHSDKTVAEVAKYTEAQERAKCLAGCVDAGFELLKGMAKTVRA